MSREKARNIAHADRRHENSRDESTYLISGAAPYPVGEYGRDYLGGQDRRLPSRIGGYPVGEFGRDYDPRDLQGNPGARDLTRYGGMYSYEIGMQNAGHRGRGPKGYRRADERIHEEACERLTDDHFVDASEIAIAVTNGEVTISGTVDSRDQKRRAESVVDTVAGVRDVHNRLRVRGTERSAPSTQDAQRQAGPNTAEKSEQGSRTAQSQRPTHH
jgi:hypothetical protein